MRLIDADKFIVTNNESFMRETYGMKGLLVEMCDRIRERINVFIDEQPTVDAVPVVRCKDCYWSYDCKGHRHCNFMAGDLIDDWYCVHGKERKTDG